MTKQQVIAIGVVCWLTIYLMATLFVVDKIQRQLIEVNRTLQQIQLYQGENDYCRENPK